MKVQLLTAKVQVLEWEIFFFFVFQGIEYPVFRLGGKITKRQQREFTASILTLRLAI
jgi:hypothetical protein